MTDNDELEGFGDGGETGGTRPPTTLREKAMCLLGAAGSASVASKLVGIDRRTLNRIASGEPVQPGSLALFSQNLEQAEQLAELLWQPRLRRRCGLEVHPWTAKQAQALADKLGSAEVVTLAKRLGTTGPDAAQLLARELGLEPTPSPNTPASNRAHNRRAKK